MIVGDPTGDGIAVGMIDSGWDRNIPDARVLPGVGLIGGTDILQLVRSHDDHDRIGHGTTCSRVLLNMAPDVRIVPIRVFGTTLETSTDILVAAIDWAVSKRLPLINLSVATHRTDAVPALYRACASAHAAGTIIVAAAANSDRGGYPAIFDSVIGVTAIPSIPSCHIATAEDEQVEFAANASLDAISGKEAKRGLVGSSYSAPVVTGWVARLMQVHTTRNVVEIRSLLHSYAMNRDPGS